MLLRSLQSLIKLCALPCPDPAAFYRYFQGHDMSSISITAMHSFPAAMASDQSFKAVALFSCLGLAASVCLTALGLDPSAGWL